MRGAFYTTTERESRPGLLRKQSKAHGEEGLCDGRTASTWEVPAERPRMKYCDHCRTLTNGEQPRQLPTKAEIQAGERRGVSFSLLSARGIRCSYTYLRSRNELHFRHSRRWRTQEDQVPESSQSGNAPPEPPRGRPSSRLSRCSSNDDAFQKIDTGKTRYVQSFS